MEVVRLHTSFSPTGENSSILNCPEPAIQHNLVENETSACVMDVNMNPITEGERGRQFTSNIGEDDDDRCLDIHPSPDNRSPDTCPWTVAPDISEGRFFLLCGAGGNPRGFYWRFCMPKCPFSCIDCVVRLVSKTKNDENECSNDRGYNR